MKIISFLRELLIGLRVGCIALVLGPYFLAAVAINSTVLRCSAAFGNEKRRAWRWLRDHGQIPGRAFELSGINDPRLGPQDSLRLKEILKGFAAHSWTRSPRIFGIRGKVRYADKTVGLGWRFGVQVSHETAYTVDVRESAESQERWKRGRDGRRWRNYAALEPDGGKLWKKAYYLEGSYSEIGTFVGRIALPEVNLMCTHYLDQVVFDFLDASNIPDWAGAILADVVHSLAFLSQPRLPESLQAEINGIYFGAAGARGPNPLKLHTLMTLNLGIDVLLSMVYRGGETLLKFIGINTKRLGLPLGCNGFSLLNQKDADDRLRHYFGRDFMFPTCKVYGLAAAPCIIRTLGPDGEQLHLPIAALAAPGMVGVATSVNWNGVAMGVDMVTSANTKVFRIGCNALNLVRYATAGGTTFSSAMDEIRKIGQGVSYIYPFADGATNGPTRVPRAAILESGAPIPVDRRGNPKFRSYLPLVHRVRGVLPRAKDVRRLSNIDFKDGLAVRDNHWQPKDEWVSGKWNKKLFDLYKLPYPPNQHALNRDGYYNNQPADPDKGPDPWKREVVPGPYYFPPQRKDQENLVICTNQYMIPEMRLLSMNPYSSFLAINGKRYNDFQWRYDELNHRLQRAIGSTIGQNDAQELVDFLKPLEKNATGEWVRTKNFRYYGIDLKGNVVPDDKILVYGAICLAELSSLTLSCRYGRYVDDWVELSLSSFRIPLLS